MCVCVCVCSYMEFSKVNYEVSSTGFDGERQNNERSMQQNVQFNSMSRLLALSDGCSLHVEERERKMREDGI